MLGAKVLLVGDGAVGKTTLRRKYMGEAFNQQYLPTFGADLSITHIEVDQNGESNLLRFAIWDLAGQVSFRKVRKTYYKHTQAIIILYDVTNPQSYENVMGWLSDIDTHVGLAGVPIALVANKIDLRLLVEDTIPTDDGTNLAKEIKETFNPTSLDVPFFETSALTGERVDDVFGVLGEHIVKVGAFKYTSGEDLDDSE